MTLAPKLGPERSKTDKSVAELNMEHHRKLPAFSDLDEEKQQTATRLLAAETERFARVHPTVACGKGRVQIKKFV